DAELIVVPWFEDDPVSAVAGFDEAAGGELRRALAVKEFTARAYEHFMTPTVRVAAPWRARRIMFVGAGPAAAFSAEVLRKVAAAAALMARQHCVRDAGFVLREDAAPSADVVELAQAAAEGLMLSEFEAGLYKTEDLPGPAVPPGWTV